MTAFFNDLFPETLPKGITYLPEYISKRQEAFLLNQIDRQTWDQAYKRRRQHYGNRYDVGEPGPGVFPGPLPGWLSACLALTFRDRLVTATPEHALVNEYLPGQGINDHVDRASQKGGIVCSLSLGSGTEMVFTEPNGRKHGIYLEPRSLVRFQGAVRDFWTHGIPARRADRIGGLSIARGRRVSITFRQAGNEDSKS